MKQGKCPSRKVKRKTSLAAVRELDYGTIEKHMYGDRVNWIASTDCLSRILSVPGGVWQREFGIKKSDLAAISSAIAWPDHKACTTHNRYRKSSTPTTLVILRRLASLCRWSDLVLLICRHPSHIHEIFWEGLVYFFRKRGQLIEGDTLASCVAQRALLYSEAIRKGCTSLEQCLWFFDGTVLAIARPD